MSSNNMQQENHHCCVKSIFHMQRIIIHHFMELEPTFRVFNGRVTLVNTNINFSNGKNWNH
jgi:hypothetical protein